MGRPSAPVRGDPTEVSQPGRSAGGAARRMSPWTARWPRRATSWHRNRWASRWTNWEGRCGAREWCRSRSTGCSWPQALGRIAAGDLVAQPWWCRDLLADRLRQIEASGGWPTLARTTLADVPYRLWRRDAPYTWAASADLSRCLATATRPPPTCSTVIETTWWRVDLASVGAGPVGADLGYLALSVREELDVLLTAYAEGLGAGGLQLGEGEIRFGATVMAPYTRAVPGGVGARPCRCRTGCVGQEVPPPRLGAHSPQVAATVSAVRDPAMTW